jgi:hypothetical protein
VSHETLAWLKEEAKRRTQLAALKAECKALGLTHDEIAGACRPPVSRSLVVHVFAARAKSQNVVNTARRLITERRRRIAAERRRGTA